MDSELMEGCLKRIERANLHIKTLRAQLQAFVDVAYEVDFELDRGVIPWEVRIYGRAIQPLKPAEFGILIGDVVNNLRAALDNMVWALSVRAQGLGNPPPSDPLPSKSPWRDVGFPIVVDGQKWDGSRQRKLKFVDPTLFPRFKQLQPFVRKVEDPTTDELAILNELWNIDKHRYPHVVGVSYSLLDVRSNLAQALGVGDLPEGVRHGYEVLEASKGGPLVERTYLGRVREKHDLMVTNDPTMGLTPSLFVGVAFQDPPAAGEPVLGLLAELSITVETALREFEVELH